MSKWSWLSGLVTGSLLTGATLALAGKDAAPKPDALFTETLNQIRQYYVQPVDEGQLADSALTGLVSSLDHYSKYLKADDIRALEEMADGHYSGLGLEVDFDKEQRLKVLAPIKGSPADKAGIQAGDLVLAINGQPVKGRALKALVDELRGQGDAVALRLSRDGVERNISLVPAEVQVPSVVAYPLDKGRLWLRLTQFQYSTPKEVRQALAKAKPRQLILDLRGDPGGVFPAAVEVADLFLDKGPIVSTHGRADMANQIFDAKSGDPYEQLPMLVLIDKDSASCAEILAGALKDRGRAKLLGQKSFGKGSVQSLIPLAGGDRALKLTTALYLTPSGTSIQGKGIVPDIPAGSLLADAGQRSRLRTHFPLTRQAEQAQEGQWADDALLWEAVTYFEEQKQP
ncbi:S41 family peptidase [Gallaecimonas kandeliae]|uniref:S41 family peptidase n=1 Tax=Gallaecimonas kandeliae TaxID=3029055 RepID=UPI00264A0433|nr:S41 family peptidase [Gallaecimonas kandeliae]WKE65476.1 S41 family peptidase [Gallaecimonas kandeliae]